MWRDHCERVVALYSSLSFDNLCSIGLQRPHETITYMFSPSGTNTMLLIPSSSHRDTRPIYHISWREDYFMPGNMITTVRRGGSERGQFVAEYK